MMTLAQWFEEKGIEKGIQQGIQRGKIYGVIEAYRDQGMPEAEILKWIQKKFTMTVDEAKEYMAHEDGK